MITIYFFYGLSFFAMGLAVTLESQRASKLALGHHMRWLGAFGLLHGSAEWLEMFQLISGSGAIGVISETLHALILPLSALLLVRFGIGLVGEAGPLPKWMQVIPAILFVPITLLCSFALIMALTAPHIDTATDVWSRYLLYLPGCLLAGVGFLRQQRSLQGDRMSRARLPLICAAAAFFVNAFAAGLIVPTAPYGLAPWLNYENVLALTGVPVQVWRMLSAVAVMFSVLTTLGIFEAERQQQLVRLESERREAQQAVLQTQLIARRHAEEWLAGLVNISRSIANLEKVDDVLLTVVALARRLMKADTAMLALFDNTREHLSLKCYALESGAYRAPSGPVESLVVLRAVQSCHSLRYPEDMALNGTPWICPILNREIAAVAIVPLQLEGQAVGGLWVSRYEYEPFTCADLVGLERLADQSVIALEHGSLAARLQSLAVVEERSRIAREMHDSVAQILGYLSLEMQTLEALVSQGDCETALSELKQARESVRAAQADVRESILCLRTTLSGNKHLIAALRQYIDEFSMQTGIDAQLLSEVPDDLALPPTVETQMVRIVQEALTNVRKHAQAGAVHVRLFTADDTLHVAVVDNGVGIEQGAIKRSHFGLQTMRERAESVDGYVMITSAPYEGTQIEVCLPLYA